jgi:hypothetical protein
MVKTIISFVSNHVNFTKLLIAFMADPRAESAEDRISGRWALFQKFNNHFTHHVKAHLDTVT